MDIIERLEELEKAATKSPWGERPTDLDDAGTIIDGAESVYAPHIFRLAKVGSRLDPRRDANAAFIVATRNALPALLAVAKAAVRLEVALKPQIDDNGRTRYFLKEAVDAQADLDAALSALRGVKL